MSYQLDNGEARAKKYRKTFHIPPRAERMTLRLGDLAQMAFVGTDGTERMWVKVTERKPRNTYSGTLANTAVSATLPPHGATVYFEPKHVIKIEKAASEPERETA